MTQKIVIASVLKPVDDVRAYWKIAQSMAKTNKYEVNIIGNEGKKEANTSKIIFHPLPINRQQLIRRYLIRYRILGITIRLQPKILIITTHELMGIALLLKVLIGTKIIYDVQENYRLNQKLKNHPLARIYSGMIGLKEDFLSHWIDHFWFAEKCYTWELSFGRENKTILQNKALDLPIAISKHKPIKLLFSGTISNYSGALDAILIMKALTAHIPDSEGVMIGQIHDPALHQSLLDEIKEHSSIQLILSYKPIPYEYIIEKLNWANLGIIAYHPNLVNQHRIPTKLYEYSRYHLPFLVQINTLWARVGSRLGNAISIDIKNPNIPQILEQLNTQKFNKLYPFQDTWEYEIHKLLSSIKNLLK